MQLYVIFFLTIEITLVFTYCIHIDKPDEDIRYVEKRFVVYTA